MSTVNERDVTDEDSEEDPEEEYEVEYEEEYEVSEEETEADPEEESNADLVEKAGSALLETVDKTVVSHALDVKNAKGKRRRSRWDLERDEDGKGKGKGKKIRKSRWGSDVGLMNSCDVIDLPESMSDLAGSELFGKLKQKVFNINQEIVRLEVHHDNPVTEESRHKQKEKLVTKRQNILKEMIKLTSKLHGVERKRNEFLCKFVKKVYVPVKEYPTYNFVGLIIGPRGNTQKKMEVESGASIKLRGKGSTMKERNVDASDDEDLHVYIEAHTEESLDAAVAMIEKLLIPLEEGKNEFKRAQLEELAKINGTLHINQRCHVCNDLGHQGIVCPNRQSTFEKVTACTKCGSFQHGVSKCLVKTKPIKEINEANLYVGFIPQTVDENRLKELFCPFGKISRVTVFIDTATGLNKGYGFVNFESAVDAAVAVKHMNGHQIDGKMLAVRIAGLPPRPKLPVLNPLPLYQRPMGPWVVPPPPFLCRKPPPQLGYPTLNPIPPYPSAVAIPPIITSQMGPWVGPTGAFINTKEPLGQNSNLYSSKATDIPSHFDPSSVHEKKGLYSANDLSQFPGDPDYRGSSSLFPGDPNYRGSGSSSLFSDFDFSK